MEDLDMDLEGLLEETRFREEGADGQRADDRTDDARYLSWLEDTSLPEVTRAEDRFQQAKMAGRGSVDLGELLPTKFSKGTVLRLEDALRFLELWKSYLDSKARLRSLQEDGNGQASPTTEEGG